MHASRGAAVAALLTLARMSVAASADRPFGLSYEAPAECPTASDLSARVRASTAHARPASGDEPHYDVSVVVARSENGFLASLQIHAPDGTETARAVPAPSCAEVVDAVSLIVALTIDPEAAAAESARQSAAATESSVEASTPNAEAPEPSPSTAESKELGESKTPVKIVGSTPPPASPREYHFLVDAGVGVVLFAIAPAPTLDVQAGAALEISTGKLFAPRLDLSLHVAESFSVTTSEGRARFERWAGRLTACPLRWGTRSIGLRPCALFEAGYYAAGGYDVTPGELVPFLWGAPGLAVRGEIGTATRWRFRAELGALFPLLSGNSFYFDPSKTNVHEIPPVGPFLEVAAEFQIL